MKLFEKRLGSYYLVEFSQDNNFYYIQLYKRCSNSPCYEKTSNIITIDIKNKDKALSIYNGINLKSISKIFKNNE